MSRIACLMMQRDEDDLIEPWVVFYASLFGIENLFVLDNGSTSSRTLMQLRKYAACGLNVDYTHNIPYDFNRKGVILRNKIRELEKDGKYDFYIPLDCDEFLVIHEDDGNVVCSRSSVNAEFEALKIDGNVFSVNFAFYNILGHPEHFWKQWHKKTFFSADTVLEIDHGYHEGTSKKGDVRVGTRFAHVHYHYKPYDTQVIHSKNKIRSQVDVENREELQKLYNKNRLVKFILDGHDEYMKRFNIDQGVVLENFTNYLQSIGLSIPFI